MSASPKPQRPRVAIFAPDPLLSVTIEARGDADELHLHPAGQGVWVARMAAELGAMPVLCSLVGGETGATLLPLLDALPGAGRITHTAGSSGSYVVDRRGGERRVVATALRPAPQRHEIDDLVAETVATALGSTLLVMCNPYPAEGLPDEVYETIVADVKAAGIPVLVDLSSPRLDRTLSSRPDLVKLNDWELAGYVRGPVDGPLALEAARALQDAGARTVAVTRAEAPILVLPADGEPFEIVPPPPDIFDRALRLQQDLAHHHGMWHRTPIPDLLIAETALHHRMGVVHVDGDFERIAKVRPLPVRRLGT